MRQDHPHWTWAVGRGHGHDQDCCHGRNHGRGLWPVATAMNHGHWPYAMAKARQWQWQEQINPSLSPQTFLLGARIRFIYLQVLVEYLDDAFLQRTSLRSHHRLIVLGSYSQCYLSQSFDCLIALEVDLPVVRYTLFELHL